MTFVCNFLVKFYFCWHVVDLSMSQHGIYALELIADIPDAIGPVGVVGCSNGLVAIFNVFDGLVLNMERLHNDDVRALVVISNGQTSQLVTTSFDGTGGVWVIRNDNSFMEFESVALLSGIHADKVLSVTALENGSRIFTAGADGRVVMWTKG